MHNNHTELHGIIPYIVSPIDEYGQVKKHVLARLCDTLIESGVHGLCVLGSAGEFPYLNDEQKEEIISCAIESTDGRVPLVSGVSGFSTEQVCKSARRAVELGVDALVVMLETYFPLKNDQIVSFYATVASAIPDCPIVIYSNPKYMHFDIPLSVFESLEKYQNIRYYKDASGNTGHILSLLNRFGKRFSVFSASAHIPAFVSFLGGVGWMAGPSCLLPRESVLLYELCVAKRYEEAITLQKKLWEINRVFTKYDVVACVKAGLQYLGFDVGDPLPPLSALSDEQANEVFSVIDAIRNAV